MSEPGYDLALRRTSFTSVLPDRLRGQTPDYPRGLVVVSGQVTKRALRAWVASNGLPSGAITVTTIEQLSRDLLSAADRTAVAMDRAWLHAAVDRYLDAADADWTASSTMMVPQLREYLRATDAGSRPDHDRLREHAAALADDGYPFDAEIAQQGLAKLRTLTDHVESAVTERHPTRPHLVAAARTAVAESWSSIYPTVEWTAFTTISRLDNPTLRLVCELARTDDTPPVEFFAGIGTVDRFDERFARAADRLGFAYDPGDGDELTALERAAMGDRIAATDVEASIDVTKVTVPDTRREAAHVLQRAAAREADGGSAGDVLAVTPEASEYRVDADDLARRLNVPVDVETRIPLVHQPVVRALRSMLELLGTPADEAVTLEDVLRPLELGSLPVEVDATNPVPDGVLSRIRRDLDDAGVTGPQSVDRWLAALASADDERVAAFATQLREARAGSPDQMAVAWLTDLVDAYPAAVSTRLDVGAGPTLGTADGSRQAAHDEPRPTDRTRSEVQTTVETAADLISSLADGSAIGHARQWEAFADLFVETVAGSGGGRSLNDADAVRFVDVGNAYFRRAPEVVVTGLSEEVFPAGRNVDGVFPSSLREAVEETADPFLHLDTQEEAVDRARDRFGAAVRCAEEQLTLLRPARDADDRERSESRFIRGLSLPDDRCRRFSSDGHPVDGLLDAGSPRWLEQVPDTHGSRLRAVALYASSTNAGQQAADREEAAARLADVAATLPEELTDLVTENATRAEDVIATFEERRDDWDADAVIDFPEDVADRSDDTTEPTQVPR